MDEPKKILNDIKSMYDSDEKMDDFSDLEIPSFDAVEEPQTVAPISEEIKPTESDIGSYSEDVEEEHVDVNFVEVESPEQRQDELQPFALEESIQESQREPALSSEQEEIEPEVKEEPAPPMVGEKNILEDEGQPLITMGPVMADISAHKRLVEAQREVFSAGEEVSSEEFGHNVSALERDLEKIDDKIAAIEKKMEDILKDI
ncbi:hypothetical protein H6504_03840 [Candidatus Woesearchaeota archaeon]|nr:hypothetical protein [Candidatus Woesearchaeota archaeon]